MSDNIIQLNQELIHNELKDLLCNSGNPQCHAES